VIANLSIIAEEKIQAKGGLKMDKIGVFV